MVRVMDSLYLTPWYLALIHITVTSMIYTLFTPGMRSRCFPQKLLATSGKPLSIGVYASYYLKGSCRDCKEKGRNCVNIDLQSVSWRFDPETFYHLNQSIIVYTAVHFLFWLALRLAFGSLLGSF